MNGRPPKGPSPTPRAPAAAERAREPLPDARAREKIRTDLDTTLIVDASAGTGKTTALVSRVVELVRSGRAEMSGIVAITFTERAAGELRLRIRRGLDEAVAEKPEPEIAARLEQARATLEEASLGTIHAFCSQLLHEHPVEAGVDPDFTILTGAGQAAFFEPLFRDWLREQLERPGPGVARLLRRSRGRDDPVDTLRDAARRLLDHRELPAPWKPPKGYDRDEAVRRLLHEDEVDQEAGENAVARVCLTTLAEVVRMLPPPAPQARVNWLVRTLADAAELEREIRVREEAGRGDPEWVEQSLATLEVKDWGYGASVPAETGERMLRAHPRLPVKNDGRTVDLLRIRRDFRERLESFRRESGADLAAQLRKEIVEGTDPRRSVSGDGANLAARQPDKGGKRSLVARYEAAKKKAGKLDFDDLLLRTRDLLDGDPGLRELLRKRYTHFLVDEFQDTDPLQTEIVFQLTAGEAPGRGRDAEEAGAGNSGEADTGGPRPGDAEVPAGAAPAGDWRWAVPIPGRLFLVGDPKQSIYRFRRAEVEHYRETKKHLLEHGANEVVLTSNFRSAPALCDFVNDAFAPLLDARPDEKTGVRQVGYSPILATRSAVSPTALASIPVPEEGMAQNAREIAALEPAAVARFISRLLASRFRVTRTDKTIGPVEPSDICLLFRRFRHYGRLVPQPYAEALQQRDLPHALGAIPSYTGSAEIGALRAALTAVEFPDDELSVYAALRGPLFSFPDEELLLFRERGLRLRPGATGPLPGDAPASDRGIAEALSFLDDRHRERNRRPVSHTIRALLDRHRAETAFAFWKSPDQVLANLRLLTQSAREFEAGGGLSFRGFVRQLEAEADDPDFGTRHALDPEVRGVRMLTVHSAKGLEFPVVILVDTPFSRVGRASRVVRPEEGLYACDLGHGLRPAELLEAEEVEAAVDVREQDRLLYVAATRARDLLAVVAPSAQYDLDRSWLRPLYDRLGAAGARAAEAPEVPGFDTGASSADAGARRWNLLSGEAKTDDDPSEGFRTRRAGTLARGAVPTRRVAPAGRYAGREFDPDPVTIHELPRPANRPGGGPFGDLVHRVLERALLDPAANGGPASAPVAELAETAAAELELDGHFVGPAAAAVEAALDHEVLRAARRAAERGACYPECPVFLREDRPAPPSPDETARASDADAPAGPSDREPDEPEPEGPILIEGKVDLLFQAEEGGAWTVVDFKTGLTDDEEEGAEARDAARERYRRQVTLYARAVTRATGQPAEPVLLFL